LKTMLMLAEQMIARLEYLHSQGWLHRDIKPDNFMCGHGLDDRSLYLIDFGLAKKYTKRGTHMPFREDLGLEGTARYCGLNVHRGYEPGRRDDLEAIGYVLAYFNLRGKLPWQGFVGEAAEVVVTFQPGPVGITLNNHTEYAVDQIAEGSQAQRLGVKEGWKAHRLDGRQFSFQKLTQLIAGSSDYTITFLKDKKEKYKKIGEIRSRRRWMAELFQGAASRIWRLCSILPDLSMRSLTIRAECAPKATRQ